MAIQPQVRKYNNVDVAICIHVCLSVYNDVDVDNHMHAIN